ncbi:MAG TPA: DUF763 domain-containing protein [Geminicoccaceae bacterium]|nr:DUF763 domain-containing protein [Geminicoccaceae bacterium]
MKTRSGRVGLADLPLHSGRAPVWLFGHMVGLAREILSHVVADYGPDEVLERLSDPFWFQAFGCVLGFDWHSSGVTTTTCGAIKEAVRGLEDDFGFVVAGGKGAASRKTPVEIERACERQGQDPAALVRASRLSAKVDNTAVQDGHQLYHHCFMFTPRGAWCVIQQGMSDATRTARRYHWLGDRVTSFVEEPHAAVCADARAPTLNLVAVESADARQATTAIAAQSPAEILAEFDHLPLLRMPARHPLLATADVDPKRLHQTLLRTYERPPADFESLLGVPGLGPKSLRALALVAELIHGARASTRDPARFAFAHGGKDGTPFPVDRATYDRTIDLLRGALGRAKVDHSDRSRALKRLAGFADDARPRPRFRA